MQSIKPDMDDLMREAAANYPVVPAGANWLHVSAMLKKDSKKEWHGVLKKLALVIPFFLAGFVCDRYMMPPRLGNGYSLNSATAKTEPQISNPNLRTTFETGALKNVNHTRRSQNQIPSQEFTSLINVRSSNTVIAPSNPSSNIEALLKEAGLARPVWSVPHFSFFNPLQRGIQKPVSPPALRSTSDVDKKYYVGLLAGTDVSSVRRQGSNKVGYSLAVAAGMTFTKSWRLETGLVWDRKNYYTSGTYFKTDKIALPPHSKVIEIAGYCNMFEWPLALGYRILGNKKTNVWVMGGTSSYFMRNEDYDYVYERYNTSYSGKSEYNQHSKHWFSMANASLAFEQKINSHINLRVEPYIRVPLRGVGIGSIPVSSKGVLVGITHPF